KEGRRHKGKGTHRWQSSESPETRDGPIGVWRREKGTIGYEEGDKKIRTDRMKRGGEEENNVLAGHIGRESQAMTKKKERPPKGGTAHGRGGKVGEITRRK
ncbi:hypothetical protein NPIL_426161, partial [Nephila pilipes]